MPQAAPFIVTLVIDDIVVTTHDSFHNLRRTLRLAGELAAKIPSAYVEVRYKGKRIADVETNWRGELCEANMYAETQPCQLGYPWLRVTPLNVHSDIFEERPWNVPYIRTKLGDSNESPTTCGRSD
jgi:hypothetical protein